MSESFFESDVLCVPQPTIGLEGGGIVGADVQDDLIARAEELGGHRAGHRGREATTAVVSVGKDIADDGNSCLGTDDVRAGRGDQPAIDAVAVIDAIYDRRGG